MTITALDTNVLLDLVIPNKAYFQTSFSALRAASQEGPLVICDLVYAELCAGFPDQDSCDRFLVEAHIEVQALTRAAHFLASRVFREYRKSGGQRSRILPDFLVASHAQLQADRLLTRDRGFYSDRFPSLTVLDPTLLS